MSEKSRAAAQQEDRPFKQTAARISGRICRVWDFVAIEFGFVQLSEVFLDRRQSLRKLRSRGQMKGQTHDAAHHSVASGFRFSWARWMGAHIPEYCFAFEYQA